MEQFINKIIYQPHQKQRVKHEFVIIGKIILESEKSLYISPINKIIRRIRKEDIMINTKVDLHKEWAYLKEYILNDIDKCSEEKRRKLDACVSDLDEIIKNINFS